MPKGNVLVHNANLRHNTEIWCGALETRIFDACNAAYRFYVVMVVVLNVSCVK